MLITAAQVVQETWEFGTPFVIARGTATHAELLVVTVGDGTHQGWAECCPTAHYGETVESVRAQVELMLRKLKDGADWDVLHDSIPPGSARNGVDCAIWDLRAKREGRSVADLIGIGTVTPVITVFTISVGEAATMAAAAAKAVSSNHSLLKIKIGDGGDDLARLRAIRVTVPDARLIVDVNEGWSESQLVDLLPGIAELGIEMLEQPLPAGKDAILASIDRLVPIGADESCHIAADVAGLVGKYDVVNIKLDKTGGLTEAMRLLEAARLYGLDVMVGCMVGTSLGMAPGLLVAQSCRFVDLDGPLLLGQDRSPGLQYSGDKVAPEPALWG